MKTKLLILLCCCFLTLALRAEEIPAPLEAAEPRRFTLEELDNMADRGEWNQLMLNLEEVVPTQRNTRWEQIVERATLGYLKTLEGQGNGADRIGDSLLTRFPFLSKSSSFGRARLEGKLASLDLCYQRPKDDPACANRMMEFARANRNESNWLRQAGETVAHRQNASAAMPYYKIWIENDRKGPLVCDDANLRRALKAAIEAGDATASDLSSGICWQAMRGELRTALGKKPSAKLRKNACALFRTKRETLSSCGD